MSDDLQRAAWRDQETPAIDRARSLEAIRRVKAGEVRFPLCCGHCGSASVTSEMRSRRGQDPDERRTQFYEVLACLSCGRLTTMQTAHIVRKQKILRYIREGVEVNLRAVRTHPPSQGGPG